MKPPPSLSDDDAGDSLLPPPPPLPPRVDDETPREAAIHNLDTFLLAPSDERIPLAGAAQRTREEEKAWEGRKIANFVVTRRLAKGGMGVVLLAQDTVLRRTVALKVMDASLQEDADALKRFEREARATAAVHHPNIAAVHAIGVSDEGHPYLVMEYIDGGSLMDRIRARAPLTFSQVALMIEQVASALQAAHRVNIIHRDIKPANIMLTGSGDAKVVDFGLAKIFFEDSYRTQEGMVLGTPSYMAPEQSQGRMVDHRADIYSLGATFYHTIAGRPPFVADSPVQIMMKHVTAPLIPMRSLNPTVPMEFDEIIGRCMRKDLDERYQDYEALLVDLKRVRLMCATREQGGTIGRPAGPSPSPAAAPQGGSSILPPPPKMLPRQPASMQSAALPAPGGVVPSPVTQDPGLSTFKMVMMAAAGVVILLAIITAVMREEKAEEEQPSRRRQPWGAAIDDAANQAAEDASVAEALTPVQRYRRTLEILESLQNGLVKYELEVGRLPSSFSGAIDENRFVMNFKMSEDGTPLDAWGRPMVFDPASRTVRSFGQDGTDSTGDELTIDLEGRLEIPRIYNTIR